MTPAHKRVMPVVVALLLAGAAAAETPRPGDRLLLQKQTRELEQRAVTRPVGPEVDATRRRLRNESEGPLGARGLQLDRRLRQVPESPQVEPPPTTRPADPPAPLPSTVSPDAGLLPSAAAQRRLAPGGGSDPVTLAARLIERADRWIASGDLARAASDLGLARQMLDGLGTPAAGSPAAPRLATARARLEAVAARL
jgi:hypothetical protein